MKDVQPKEAWKEGQSVATNALEVMEL